MIRTSIRRF